MFMTSMLSLATQDPLHTMGLTSLDYVVYTVTLLTTFVSLLGTIFDKGPAGSRAGRTCLSTFNSSAHISYNNMVSI